MNITRKHANKVITISFVLIYFSLLGRVLYKVLSGEGLSTYNSVSLVQWNYTSALILLLTIPMALFLGYIFSKYLSYRERNKWEKVKNEIRKNT